MDKKRKWEEKQRREKLGSNGEFIGQDTETERRIVKYPKIVWRYP